MDRLPDDIVHEIAGHLDIDSFLTFSSCNKRIHVLYKGSMASVAEAVARNTFPTQERILLRQPDETANIAWLMHLKYKQLAAIVLERYEGVSAEDPLAIACGGS